MDLIPESIKGDNTLALDKTFLERLLNLGAEQLTIDFTREIDPVKLSLWLEQFGIPSELLPDDLDAFTLRDLMPLTVKIYNLSGTETSIVMLAEALGATGAKVIRDCFALRYDHQARYDGLFRYNNGEEYKGFAIDVQIEGITPEKEAGYEATFRKLFKLFESVHLYLRNVIFL